MTPTRIVFAAIIGVSAIFLLTMMGQLVQNVSASEIVVIQSPWTGDLVWHTDPGPKWQGFGKVTSYPKRAMYEFTKDLRFNDGFHGELTGNIQFEMPMDPKSLTMIHTKFGSIESVQTGLVKAVVDKAIYMTGPIMSSKESYAERRNSLIYYIEDQIEGGVYKTRQRSDRVKDPVTGAERTITIVDIVMEGGSPARQEAPFLTSFGIKPTNLSIVGLTYESAVEDQIQMQAKATMEVETAMAQSRKAEQDALTVAKQGEAEAARRKWAQEAIKAQAVTQAEQEKEVAVTQASQRLETAKLDAAAAEQYRIRKLREAEADATYKRQVMSADGALAQKLETYLKVQQFYASALAQYKGAWVPNVVMGQNQSAGIGSAQQLIDMLSVKTARDLSLDMSLPGGGGPSR